MGHQVIHIAAHGSWIHFISLVYKALQAGMTCVEHAKVFTCSK